MLDSNPPPLETTKPLAPIDKRPARGWRPSWYQVAIYLLVVAQLTWIERSIEVLMFCILPLLVPYAMLFAPDKSWPYRLSKGFIILIAIGVTISPIPWLFPQLAGSNTAEFGSFQWRG